MNLKDLRYSIANILDYYPDIPSYNEQINEIINNHYLSLFSERPFSFAQKEEVVSSYADVELTNISFTQNDALITAATSKFEDNMAGRIIGVGDVEYEISWVKSGTQAYLTQAFNAATTTTNITIKHRYIDLPQDCSKVLQVFQRSIDFADARGTMEVITRFEDEYYNLPLDQIGDRPESWIPYDDYTINPPKHPVFNIVTHGSGHGERTLEMAVTWTYAGKESSLSAITELELEDTEEVEFSFSNLPNTSGYIYKVYARNKSFSNEFFHVADSGGGTQYEPDQGGTYNFVLPASDFNDAFALNNEKYQYSEGNRQRIRLYPRQSEDTELTVRYSYRPKRLVDDHDVPEFPSIAHNVLVYLSLREIFIKHNNFPQAKRYDRKSSEELQKLENNYIKQHSKRWIKGFMIPGEARTFYPYSPLKKL